MHISILIFVSPLNTERSVPLFYYQFYIQLTLNIFLSLFRMRYFFFLLSLSLVSFVFFLDALATCIKSMIIKCVWSSSLVTYRVSVNADKYSDCVYFYFQRNGITRSQANVLYRTLLQPNAMQNEIC